MLEIPNIEAGFGSYYISYGKCERSFEAKTLVNDSVRCESLSEEKRSHRVWINPKTLILVQEIQVRVQDNRGANARIKDESRWWSQTRLGCGYESF